MKNIFLKIFGFVAVAGLTTFTAVVVLANKEKVETKIYRKNPDLKVLVKTYTIKEEKLSGNLQFLGTFQPNREIDLLSETNGKVVMVNVQKGQSISAGHLIAKVDNDLSQAQMIMVKANYEKALADVQRYENAVAGDAMPKINLENAKLGLKNAESQLKMLQKQLSLSQINAPFGGIITMKMFDLGSVLAQGTPLIKLTDISQLKLTVNIPEKEISNLRIGQSLKIKTDIHPEKDFFGTIITIAAKGDVAHNFETEVLLNNSNDAPLRAGMYGNIFLEKEVNQTALLIPRNALIGSAKKPQVYVVKNNVATLKDVVLGGSNGEMIQVNSGLSAGEIVVISGQINLSDNTPVSFENENSTLKLK
ncbi:MAG: efflux RND transporter periplasmic adaptor subunit [Cytophagales bacterium]|nr:MAG: efflux RND transporter periplasmic adaptor subunit [Cytophagales bacterium]